MINIKLLDEISQKPSRVLAVTKYFDTVLTKKYISSLSEYKELIYGYGENRLEQVLEKGIQREECHFIGNIQSRKISDIVDNCSVIHSVASKKHFLLFQKIAKEQQKNIKVFLQLNLDKKKDIGFSEFEIQNIVSEYTKLEYFEIIGISGMGAGAFTETEKKAEFQKLIDTKNVCLPGGLISAGTSRDYKIALSMGIDIIRIGQALFE